MASSHRERVVGHLPLEMTTMVGRRRETIDIRNRMASQRLVTLTGPGGVGKTRTALQVAHQARRTYVDGAWFVELGPVVDSALVGQVVLETLKVPDFSARDARTTLVDYLRDRQVLLVLDNCEHLVTEVAGLVATLQQQVAGAHVLATSRQPLGVPGEATYRIDPLPVPDEQVADVTEVAGYAAVELFVSRTRAALGGFEVDASNQRDVVRLCARLEGLPLALELAATRLRVMTIQELLQRLDDRFGMLKGSGRVGSPRHHTLLATVTWSHDLCTTAEQLLWRRASVFTGTFDLAGAEIVCADDELPREQVLDALLGLVDKSVVLTERQHAGARFRMLETLGDFGAERLAEAGETDRFRAAHAAWCSERVAQAAAEWFGPRQVEWTTVLRLEQSNLRSALDFCATHPEHARAGQQMAGSLWFHWVACEYLSQGRLWLERLVAADTTPSPERALALGTTAWVAALQGETARAVVAALECQQIAYDLARMDLVAYGTHMRALAAFFGNHVAEAEDLSARARTLYSETDVPAAWPLLLLVQNGAMHALVGDVPTSAALFEELLARSEQHGDQWARSYAVWGHGLVCFREGRFHEAATLQRQCIEMKRPFRDVLGLTLAVDVLAWTLAAKGEAARAARLVGTASALWLSFGIDLFGSEFYRAQRAQCEATAREQLGDAAYDEAVREGAAASLDDTLRELVDHEPERPVSRSNASILTRREREVAGLVAEGLTNQEIADRLVISLRTAEGHVEHILRKMDFRSRTQIAAWFAARAAAED
jgi:non-specific serine/threonine protein kinase